MAAARDKPIKQGYLFIPPLLKKKWQKKYCVLYTFSTLGVERLEIYDSEDEAAKRSCWKLITLDNCVKISLEAQKNQPHAFSVITKNDRHFFAGTNYEDSMSWVVALQGVAFQDSFSSTTIEEDNELYCPSGDAGVFRVVLVSTEASQRCGLFPGDYTLVVATEELQIRNPDTQNLLFTWPYRFIRRYGHKRGRFNFEAGRKCASGEGSFDLEHNNAQEIFKCMSSKMDLMKQRLGNSNASLDKVSMVNSTMRTVASNSSISPFFSQGSPDVGIGLLIDDDEGLDAARTMSARSRSPLISQSSPITPICVPTTPLAPMKPPRKNPPVPVPVPRYDHVEVRTEAWRTHGTDNIHLERQSSERSTIVSAELRPPNPKAVFIRPLAIPDITHSDYDQLDHFGSTPKLDENPSYSTINRSDTSGYGVIRKPVHSPRHEVYNDFEYAMVTKPHHHQASHIV